MLVFCIILDKITSMQSLPKTNVSRIFLKHQKITFYVCQVIQMKAGVAWLPTPFRYCMIFAYEVSPGVLRRDIDLVFVLLPGSDMGQGASWDGQSAELRPFKPQVGSELHYMSSYA